MIERLEISEICKVNELEEIFFHYFKNNSVNRHYSNNDFTEIFTISNEDKSIVGFMILDIIYERMELIQIEISETFQNMGYANRLLQFMLKKAKEEAIENITLEVREDNYVAIHLYEKYGFEEVAVRKNYYHGKNGILMERKMM